MTRPYEALKTYERAVYQRKPESNQALQTMLNSLMLAGTTSGLMSPDAPPDVLRGLYTRFAAAMTTHVLSPSFQLTNTEFYYLCNHKIVIESAFALSGFGDAQHLLDYLLEVDAEGYTVLKESTVFITCLFFSLDNIPDALFEAALGLNISVLLPLMLGWISTHRVLTPDGERRRSRLLESHELIHHGDLPIEMFRAVCHSWMYCTYADTPRRHEIKRTLNELTTRLGVREGVRPRSVARRKVPKPRLLLAAERWKSNHAMYRCYAPSVEQLKERFHLTLLADEGEWDETSRQLFDEVQGIRQIGIKMTEIVAAVIKVRPDIIYYPSIGMSAWTVVSANHRLAPIQCMTGGHPATSMSEHIDYFLVPEKLAEAEGSIHERVIVWNGNLPLAPYPGLQESTPEAAKPDDVLFHVAVHASAMKLSARFLSTCRKLIDVCGKPLHFRFFPGSAGVGMDDLRIRLPTLLPGAKVTVEPYMPYDALLAALSTCDLALAPYPFGNTNSTTDTCLVGLPTVCYRAPELHCLGDKLVIQAAGLPDWLLTTDDESYLQTARNLICDDALRNELREQLLSGDLRDRLFNPAADEEPGAFGKAMWWLYENHEAIQASADHVLRVPPSAA